MLAQNLCLNLDGANIYEYIPVTGHLYCKDFIFVPADHNNYAKERMIVYMYPQTKTGVLM